MVTNPSGLSYQKINGYSVDGFARYLGYQIKKCKGFVKWVERKHLPLISAISEVPNVRETDRGYRWDWRSSDYYMLPIF